MNQYRVHLRSKPGMWERYEGYVDVVAEDEGSAPDAAIDRLMRTTFPDRGRSGWTVQSVEPRERTER